MSWTSEWPIEPGWYWFYGWPFSDRDKLASLYCVEVWKLQNGYAYVTHGHFMYKGEGAEGLWQPMTLPELPQGEANVR